MNALLHLTSYLLPRLSYQLETKFETFKEITRDQDQDLSLLVSRPRPRPLKNELECTRVTRPWSRDHNTDLYWIKGALALFVLVSGYVCTCASTQLSSPR